MRAQSLTALNKLVANCLVGRHTNSLFVGKPNLTSRLVKRHTVKVVLDSVGRDYDVTDNQVLRQTSGDARVDNDVGLVHVNHNLSAHSGVNLADSALQKHNVLVKNLTACKFKTCFFGDFGVFHKRLKTVNLNLKRTDNANHFYSSSLFLLYFLAGLSITRR